MQALNVVRERPTVAHFNAMADDKNWIDAVIPVPMYQWSDADELGRITLVSELLTPEEATKELGDEYGDDINYELVGFEKEADPNEETKMSGIMLIRVRANATEVIGQLIDDAENGDDDLDESDFEDEENDLDLDEDEEEDDDDE